MAKKDQAEEAAEEEAVEEEAAEVVEGAEAAEATAALKTEPVAETVVEKPEEPVKAKPSDELKIVIILNDGKVMLGVQKTDCDPVYTTFDGTLPTALQRVPKLVKEAKQKWSENPRNPDANLPTPEPAPAPARTVPAAKKETKQPSFF